VRVRSPQKIQQDEIAEQKRMAAALKAEFAAKKAAEAARKQAAPSGYAAVACGGAAAEEEMFWEYGQSQAALQQQSQQQQPLPSPPPQQRPQVRLCSMQECRAHRYNLEAGSTLAVLGSCLCRLVHLGRAIALWTFLLVVCNHVN